MLQRALFQADDSTASTVLVLLSETSFFLLPSKLMEDPAKSVLAGGCKQNGLKTDSFSDHLYFDLYSDQVWTNRETNMIWDIQKETSILSHDVLLTAEGCQESPIVFCPVLVPSPSLPSERPSFF